MEIPISLSSFDNEQNRKKIRKITEDLQLQPVYPTNIYKEALHPTKVKYTFFQVYIEHSQRQTIAWHQNKSQEMSRAEMVQSMFSTQSSIFFKKLEIPRFGLETKYLEIKPPNIQKLNHALIIIGKKRITGRVESTLY